MASERSQRARIAALSRVAREPSGRAMTAPKREAFWDNVYAAAGVDMSLPEEELERAKAAARRAYMTRLSRTAALKRRKAAQAVDEAIDAEAEMRAADVADAV